LITPAFAPGTAICSAIALPMPRDEPAMTTILPVMSNRDLGVVPFRRG
jgi:hypothetical protein